MFQNCPIIGLCSNWSDHEKRQMDRYTNHFLGDMQSKGTSVIIPEIQLNNIAWSDPNEPVQKSNEEKILENREKLQVVTITVCVIFVVVTLIVYIGNINVF